MTRRAVVLGAGGEAGIAWEVGLLAGLAAHGVDLTAADLVVGTSAGAGVAARMNSGIGLATLYGQQLVSAEGEIVARMGPRAIAGFLWATGLARHNPARARVRLGRLAVRARTGSAAARRAVVAARSARTTGARTAADHRRGRRHRQVRDVRRQQRRGPGRRGRGQLRRAGGLAPGRHQRAALDGRRMRSPANADLSRVRPRRGRGADHAGLKPMPSVTDQLTELARSCQAVAVVAPDAASVAGFGRNLLDTRTRAPSARAGYAQAAAVRPDVAAVWG
jgi:NTE family protein